MEIRRRTYEDPDALPGRHEKCPRAPWIQWEGGAPLSAALKNQKLDHTSGHLRIKQPCAIHA